MMEFLKGKTVIIIAHRINTIKEVDKIYLFKVGELVAKGSFKELLNENLYFKQLWNLGKET